MRAPTRMAFSSHEHTRPAQFNRGDLLRAGGMLGVCLLLMLIFQVPSPGVHMQWRGARAWAC